MSTIEVAQPTTAPAILDPRVERGAAMLDERLPGWEHEIDLDNFVLHSPCKCIFGQLGGGEYFDGAKRVGFPAGDAHGTFSATFSDYALMEQDWRLAILARRMEAKP